MKQEIVEYVKQRYTLDTNILDVGAGAGIYAENLRRVGFENLDAIEVFERYVVDYSLEFKYRKVFVEDIRNTTVELNAYDLVILGDVLEHLSEQDARKLLDKLLIQEVIISVPYNNVQEECYGNKYEIHLQDTLTHDKFLQLYPEFIPFGIMLNQGVYFKKNNYNEHLPLYVSDLTLEQETYVNQQHREVRVLKNKF